MADERFVMATLSMFFGIIIKMYKERDGKHNGTFFKIEPLR